MAIRGYGGEKMTPKQRAQEMLLSAAGNAVYALEDDSELTESEKARVLDQLEKQFQRIERTFGYEPGSWSMG